MPGDHGSKVDISFAGRFTASAIAACFAEVSSIYPSSLLPRCWIAIAPKSDLLPSISLPPPRPYHPVPSPLIIRRSQICTIPLDTAKVRLQLQKNVVAAAAAGDAAPALPKYRGLLGTAATIAREEGAAALWKGIVPGLHRQCIYGGLRIGLYEPVLSSPVLLYQLFILSLINYNCSYISFPPINYLLLISNANPTNHLLTGQILLRRQRPCWGCASVQEGSCRLHNWYGRMDRHPYLVFIHYFFHSPIVTLLIDSSTC
jgi:hypothetical protein